MLSALLLVAGLQCVNAYDRNQIREKLLAIGMPESEITDSVLTKYVDFTNASLENEAKFDNEILAQLKKDNSAKWEEMKQQALKAQQEADQKRATEAALEAKRKLDAINSPENLRNPNFSDAAKKIFDAYQDVKKIFKEKDNDTYFKATFLPIDDEKYLMINDRDVQNRVFSYIDSTQIGGFYTYLKSLQNGDRFWSKNEATKPLVDAVIAKVKKKNVQENIDNIKNALAQLYTDYGNYVTKKFGFKEKGNEAMFSMPDYPNFVALFKNGKFYRALVPDKKSFTADKLLWNREYYYGTWLVVSDDSNYYPTQTSDHGMMMAKSNGKGGWYGFIDFDYDLYVNQKFCEQFNELVNDNKDLYWLVRSNNLSVPEKIDGDPYSKLKYLDENGQIYTNLVSKDGEYTTKELIAKYEKQEEADTKAEQAKEQAKKAEQQASWNKIVARCKASNYVELSIYNIVGLIEKKYIVKAYKSGATYMDVTNKWGAKRRLHIVDGYVVDQYILR